MNLYVGEVNFVPTKDGKLGVAVYYLEDFTGKISMAAELPFGTNTISPNIAGAATFTPPNTKKIWTAGLNAAFNVGPVTLSGFGLYQFGKIEFIAPRPRPSDIDVNGYAADLRVDMKLGPGKFFIEGIYISGGDNTADEYKSIVTLSDVNASPGGNSAYSRTDMYDPARQRGRHQHGAVLHRFVRFSIVTSGSRQYEPRERRPRHVAHRDRLYHAVGQAADRQGRRRLPGGVRAAQDRSGRRPGFRKKGKGMGTEVNANLNYNIMKGLDFGVYGAYAWAG